MLLGIKIPSTLTFMFLTTVGVENVYVGVAATVTLSECFKGNQSPQGVREVRLPCQTFMVELVEQIRLRLSALKSKMFDDLKFLYPSNVVNCHPASLLEEHESFKFLDVAPPAAR